MKRVLLLRLSAIGDVAMLIPVIYSAAKHHPEIHFTLITQTFLKPLFINKPENITIVGFDLKGKERSLWGIFRSLNLLIQEQYDITIDLHNVLRSIIMRIYLRVKASIPFFVINKGRKEKRMLTRKKSKRFTLLESTFERYHDVFEKAGIRFPLDFVSVCEGITSFPSDPYTSFLPKNETWIGIAPFAKHKGKIYPLEKMGHLIAALSATNEYRIFLFGGGKEEKEKISHWVQQYTKVHSMSGKYSLDQEILFMRHLDLMITMDSANMHFASLVGIPVLSFWGQTHPYTGFYPWKQPISNAIQASLNCRPCSVFGNKECYRKDWACLNMVSEEDFLHHIATIIKKDK